MDRLRENPAEALRLVNMVVGGLMIAAGVRDLIDHSFSSIIVGLYIIIAGLTTLYLEIRPATEQQKALIGKYASFMHSFGGRGVFYVVVGVLMLNYNVLLYIAGSIVGLVGVGYFVLHWVPVVEAPSTMQPVNMDEEAQPVWQAPAE